MSNNNIKKIRKDLGINQIEMANLLSISQSTLSNYECGRRRPCLKICYKIINLLKIKNIIINLEYLRPE